MNGLAPDEYRYARNVATRALYTRSIARSMENSSYVRKCADAFVYGSAIVSAKDEAGFFMTSGLPDSTGMRLLNAYVASLLPECASPAGSVSRPVFRPDDTLKLDTGPGLPVKVRKTRRTGISDSDIWHFQNGMTAIYRKMPTDGIIHYSWILNSGYGNVSDMKPGEGAFYSDMLFNGKIGGMNGRDFMRLLAAEGIEMKAAAGLSSTGIYGSAPFNRLGLLLKALQSLSRTYSGDEDAERYFMGCERLRLSSARGEYQSRLTVIDSIMNPGYRYSGNKSLAGLYPDLPQRAEEFYKDLLSRPDDGVLVLVGDMEAYDVKHVLEQYMGGFEVVAAMVKALDHSLGITVPVALHLDHGTYEGAKKCIEAGFTSIMFDGSHFPFEENLAKTTELVNLAHDKGLSIEAEVGAIGGTEDGVTADGEVADPAECKTIASLGVDFLAAGIGNIHGIYPTDWKGLHFESVG